MTSGDGVIERQLELARNLEAKGEVEAASQVYLRIGRPVDAARVLASAGQHREAGESLVAALGNASHGKMTSQQKKLASRAAVFFAKAGDHSKAVDLLLAAGDPQRAATVLERAGDMVGAARIRSEWNSAGFNDRRRTGNRVKDVASKVAKDQALRLEKAGDYEGALSHYLDLGDFKGAARMSLKLKKHDDAAELFSKAEMPYPAAQCFERVGQLNAAYQAVVRVSTKHKKYRAAAALAARIADKLDHLDFRLDQFMSIFLKSAPLDEKEAQAFCRMASLYQRNDFPENALELLVRIDQTFPNYQDVAARIVQLEEETNQSSQVLIARIQREDAAFHRAADKNDGKEKTKLPSLPPLPDAPVNSMRAARPPGQATGQPAPAPAPFPDATMQHGHGVQHGAPAPAPAPNRPSTHVRQTPDSPIQAGGAIDPNDLIPGTIVDKRYRIEREIGRGGMGAVFEAYDLELDEAIALKFYYGAAANDEMVERFKRELALSRRLSHPNIVQVFDIGTWRGGKFMSMELLQGEDLTGKLEAGAGFEKLCNYFMQAASGLEAAHKRGIVHRDIKPDNFFVTTEDVVKVMDFGIAKKLSTPGITRTGFLAGTPHYIAPEQINSFNKVDHRADIYALGVIAYFGFTGELPFDAEELMPLLMMHINETPRFPRELNPNIPEEIEAFILKMMSKTPDERPQSCEEISAFFETRFRKYERARRILEGAL